MHSTIFRINIFYCIQNKWPVSVSPGTLKNLWCVCHWSFIVWSIHYTSTLSHHRPNHQNFHFEQICQSARRWAFWNPAGHGLRRIRQWEWKRNGRLWGWERKKAGSASRAAKTSAGTDEGEFLVCKLSVNIWDLCAEYLFIYLKFLTPQGMATARKQTSTHLGSHTIPFPVTGSLLNLSYDFNSCWVHL